jgi:hypothetical protein
MSSFESNEQDVKHKGSTSLIEKTTKVFFGVISSGLTVSSLIGFAITGHPLALCSTIIWGTATLLTLGCDNVGWIARETLRTAANVHERLFIPRSQIRVIETREYYPSHTPFSSVYTQQPPPSRTYFTNQAAARPQAPSNAAFFDATARAPVGRREQAPPLHTHVINKPAAMPQPLSNALFFNATARAPVGRREPALPSRTHFTNQPAAMPQAPSNTAFFDTPARAPVGRREPAAPFTFPDIIAAPFQERAPVGERREENASTSKPFDPTERAPVGERRGG